MDLGEVGLLLVTRGEEEARRAIEEYVRASDDATRSLEENAQRIVRAEQARERAIQRQIKAQMEMVREASNLRRAYEDLSASFSTMEKAHLDYYRTEEMLNKALKANVITETEHARVLELVTQRLMEAAAAVRVQDEEARIALQERANAELAKAKAQYDSIVGAVDKVHAANVRLAESQARINEAYAIGAISREEMLHGMKMIQEQYDKDNPSERIRLLDEQKRKEAEATAEKDKYSRAFDRLNASINPSIKAQQQFDAAIETLSGALRTGAISADVYDRALEDLRVTMDRAGHTVNQYGEVMSKSEKKLAKFARGGFQQLGYQVGDFAVQVQSGTSALVAFGQQGAQLAGIFGATGAIIGAGIAIVTALAQAYVMASGGGKSLSETVNEMNSSFQQLNTTIDSISENDYVSTFGDMSAAIRTMTESALALDSAMSLKNMRDTLEKLKSEYVDPGFIDRTLAFISGIGDPITVAADQTTTAKMNDETRKRNFEQMGFDMGYDVFVGYQKAIDEAAKAGDLARVSEKLTAMFVEAAPDIESAQKIVASGGYEMLDAYRQLALAVAEAQAKLKEYKDTGGIDTVMVVAEERGHMEAINSATDAAAKSAYKRWQEESKIVDVIDVIARKASEERGHIEAIRSAQSDNALLTYRQWQETEKAARESKNFADAILDAYRSGKDLANLNIAGGIVTAAEAAATLAEKLGISLGAASRIVSLSGMTPEQRFISTGVSSGALPPAALNSVGLGKDVIGAPTTFPINYLNIPGESVSSGGGGGKRDPMEELRAQIKLEQEMLGLTEEQRRVYQALGEDRSKYSKAELDAVAAEIAALEEKKRAIEEYQSIADTIQSSMSDAFMSIVDGTATVEDAFREMARSIIAQLYEVLVVQQLVGQWNQSTQEGTGLVGALMRGISGITTQANGGAWMNGNQIVPYANGGIVMTPTMFGMSGGRRGLMGESGPEAILPLKRTSNGKLGVVAAGGASSAVSEHVHVNNNFNISGSDAETVRREIDKALPRIAEVSKAAVLDARRRGGKMMSTFG